MNTIKLEFKVTPSTTVLQNRVKELQQNYLMFYDIWPAHQKGYLGVEETWEKIEDSLYTVHDDDLLFYGAEIIRVLFELKSHSQLETIDLSDTVQKSRYDGYINDIDQLIYNIQTHLARNGSRIRYEDVFEPHEMSSISKTVDEILLKLDELKLGQQFIYDDLYASIADLKTQMVFGRRSFRERLAGIILTFSTEKAIEFGWKQIQNDLFALVKNMAVALSSSVIGLLRN